MIEEITTYKCSHCGDTEPLGKKIKMCIFCLKKFCARCEADRFYFITEFGCSKEELLLIPDYVVICNLCKQHKELKVIKK